MSRATRYHCVTKDYLAKINTSGEEGASGCVCSGLFLHGSVYRIVLWVHVGPACMKGEYELVVLGEAGGRLDRPVCDRVQVVSCQFALHKPEVS